jgi:ribosome-binding protein aMBF1 (putative translation factor)
MIRLDARTLPMKPPDLPAHEEVPSEHLDAEQEWERIALARVVAVKVLAYRLEHGLSQAALAARLKMTQPAVVRLESTEHNLTRARLLRVSQTLED